MNLPKEKTEMPAMPMNDNLSRCWNNYRTNRLREERIARRRERVERMKKIALDVTLSLLGAALLTFLAWFAGGIIGSIMARG